MPFLPCLDIVALNHSVPTVIRSTGPGITALFKSSLLHKGPHCSERWCWHSDLPKSSHRQGASFKWKDESFQLFRLKAPVIKPTTRWPQAVTTGSCSNLFKGKIGIVKKNFGTGVFLDISFNVLDWGWYRLQENRTIVIRDLDLDLC